MAASKVPWGSRINLSIGGGLQEEQILGPDLIGMTFAEAKQMLEDKGINLASVIAPGVRDTAAAFVYKQNPERYDVGKQPVYIRPGQTMDLWLTSEPVDVDSLKIKNDKDLYQ